MKKFFLIFLFLIFSDLGAMRRSHECLSINEISSVKYGEVCYSCWRNINCGDDIVRFSCGHRFHSECVETNDECFVCNKGQED